MIDIKIDEISDIDDLNPSEVSQSLESTSNFSSK